MTNKATYAFIFEKQTNANCIKNLITMGHSQDYPVLLRNTLSTFNKIENNKYCRSTKELKNLFDIKYNQKANNPLKSGYVLTYDSDKISSEFNISELTMNITFKYAIINILSKYVPFVYLSKTYEDWTSLNRQVFLNNKKILSEAIKLGYIKMYEIVNMKYKEEISYDLTELKLNDDLTLGSKPKTSLISTEDIKRFEQATEKPAEKNNPATLSQLNMLLKIEATLQDKTSEELIQSLISDKAKKIFDLF